MRREIWKDYFDIVILPPAAVRDHAIALSRELKKAAGGAFVLGKRSYLPHISLYHIPVRPRRFAQFSSQVRGVASDATGGSLRLCGVESSLLMTNKPAWLRRLHLEVVRSTLPFFDWKYGAEQLWNIDRIPSRLQTIARRNLMEFGSPMIGTAFRPHITLTSFKNKDAGQNLRVDFKRMDFAVAEIAICELGPHHSCQRVIEVVSLG